jgi:hypothetical protein
MEQLGLTFNFPSSSGQQISSNVGRTPSETTSKSQVCSSFGHNKISHFRALQVSNNSNAC